MTVHEPVRLSDYLALALALALHGALGLGMAILGQRPPPPPSRLLQFDVRKPPPPPALPRLEPPKPEPEPPPPPKKPKAQRTTAPIPNKETPPPPVPAQKHFGVTEDSVTTGPSDFAVPTGNSTIADPKSASNAREATQPLAPAPPQAAPGPPAFKAASAMEIKDWPDWDEESCKIPYPEQAQQEGIEGVVFLKVQIDERGKVHQAKVIKGVGHGLDEAALRAVRTRCRFGPAKDQGGHPVPAEITYKYNWTLSS